MRTIITALSVAVALSSASGFAAAQPAQPQPPPDQPADPWADPNAPVDPVPASDVGDPALEPRQPTLPDAGFQAPVPRPERKIDLPVMFNAPTGHLLPAGVILGTLGLDTGGGFSTDARIGLGDVAEFGFGTSDLIGVTQCDVRCGKVDAVQPYGLAQFKMGVAEDRLFANQPAMSLGFRKSFERSHDGRKTRVAELYLVGSKKLGSMTQIHFGGVFWDAGVRRDGASDDEEVLLHDGGVGKQLRAFGGIEIEPLPRSKLMLEVIWTPEFRLSSVSTGQDSITLRPMFAWGVRYQFTKWGIIESGVRIPDIEDINLLDAQIFGQLKLVSRRFSNFLEGLK
jgi:hypothetical protein